MCRSLFHCLNTLFILITCFTQLKAQVPPIQWQRSYGGTDLEAAMAVCEAANGGYVAVGYSESNNGDHLAPVHGNSDFWVLRLNNYGGIIWERSFGGFGNDEPSAVIKTASGYTIAGNTTSSDGDISALHGIAYPYSSKDFWVIAIDTAGNLLWEHTYGGTLQDNLGAIRMTNDGGYIMAGYTNSNDGDVTNYHDSTDGWVVKVNDTGAISWQKTLGGNRYETAKDIQQTYDNGYIVAGNTNSGSLSIWLDFWVVKLNDTGGVTWQKTFGGSGVD